MIYYITAAFLLLYFRWLFRTIASMIKKLLLRGRQFTKSQPLSVNYGIDGLLTLGAMSIASNNNNLFAQRLGATDFQLSMLQFFPHIITLLILIPAGIFTDSLRNKRKMITLMLLLAGGFFLIVSTSAFMPVHTVYFFLIFFAMASVSVNGLYNIAWQSFFPEAVHEENRNTVLTFRARMTMLVSLVVPLIVGGILFAIPTQEGKINAHQIFYVIAALLLISNVIHFRKIQAVVPPNPKRISLTEMKTAFGRLVRNKPFIVFTLAILFFHMSWHIDWTLFFIGQANYMQMNELLLGFSPVVAMLAQLLTLKFWSKGNTKRGVDKSLTFGIFGMLGSPIGMMLGITLPQPFGIAAFLCFQFIGHLAFANIALSLFQCLLKVVDHEYRSFFIAIYTCLMTFSNAIMPVVGVTIYRNLGGDANALRITFAIVFAMRAVAGVLWLVRLKYVKSTADLAGQNTLEEASVKA